jgi:hypothetical protein
MDEYKWGNVTMLADGHRLFQELEEPKRYAIADDSGREPQDCDDGILWLDFDRDLEIGSDNGREIFTIPVIVDRQDENSRTISNAATLLWLAVNVSWPLTVDHTTYAVQEV